jgi:hypothetical protein
MVVATRGFTRAVLGALCLARLVIVAAATWVLVQMVVIGTRPNAELEGLLVVVAAMLSPFVVTYAVLTALSVKAFVGKQFPSRTNQVLLAVFELVCASLLFTGASRPLPLSRPSAIFGLFLLAVVLVTVVLLSSRPSTGARSST